jgi:hypothetical protein
MARSDLDWKGIFSKFGSFPWLPWTVAIFVLILVMVGAVELMPWNVLVNSLKAPNTLSREVWVWVTASLLCFAVVNGIFYLAHSLIPQKTPNAAMLFSVFWAIAIAVLMLLLIFALPDVEPGYGVLSGIAGGVIGWLLGIYISPEDTSEQKKFAKIGTAIIALFSGYTLKVAIDWLSKDASKEYRIYCGLFALSGLVCMAAVYNTRAYGNKGVRISFPGTAADPKDKQKVLTTIPADIQFAASARGVPDTSVTWEIVPKPGGIANVNATLVNGHFLANQPATYIVSARSNYDPKLVDVVQVTVHST